MRPLALALVLLPLVATLTAAGCGQSVATCESDCTLIGQPGTENVMTTSPGSAQQYVSCSGTCEADQATATAAGRGADFQDLLTCVSNAGSFAPGCYSLACGETNAFGTPTGCGASDAGAASGDGTASVSCIDVGGACVRPSGFECTTPSTPASCEPGYYCCMGSTGPVDVPDAVATPDVVVVVVTPTPDASAGDAGVQSCVNACPSMCVDDPACIEECEEECEQ
jgi:hypothetical protein